MFNFFFHQTLSQKIILYTPLRIHCWGGYGSQLNAALLSLKVLEIRGGSRITIFQHSSGVTYRGTEVPFELLGFRVKFIDDFTSKHYNSNAPLPRLLGLNQGFISIFRRFAKFSLESLRFNVGLNSEEDLRKIKSWTLSVRGHYSNLNFCTTHTDTLYRVLFENQLEKTFSQPEVMIHFRLGDLLSLHSKTYIEPVRILQLFSKRVSDHRTIHVYSDSIPEISSSMLADLETYGNLIFKSEKTEETIRAGVNAKIFIGTNSKVSAWIAILRGYLFGKESYLPIEMGTPSLKQIPQILFF